jgi:AraC family transcriptional regulator
LGNVARSAGGWVLPAKADGYHPLGAGRGFAARDCVCHAGVRDPTYQGSYSRACIAVVVSGAFHYRSSGGEALLGPGSMLLGSSGAGFEYRHFDDSGDRSILFDYDEEALEDARRSLGVLGRTTSSFERAFVPASIGSVGASARALTALSCGHPEVLQEAAISALAVALAASEPAVGRGGALRSRHERVVTAALRSIEADPAENWSLDALASAAGLSTFHFLRIFSRLTGQTPRQYVRAIRLRAAAERLATTRAKIVDIALESGFGDLSHFNLSFSAGFGMSPRSYRRRNG